jgi:hypothetical protein
VRRFIRSFGWLVLCAALAAGFALWRLYVVGLVFLLIAALALSGKLPGNEGTLVKGRTESRSIPLVWLLLCGVLAAGLALWSLYLVGLGFVVLAAILIARAPMSKRWRVSTLIAMLAGFEMALATLTALYWLVWDRRDGGWYLYLLVLAAAGVAIQSSAVLAVGRKAVARHR